MFVSESGLILNKPRVHRSVATTTLTVSNTTGSITMFTLTGSVLVYRLWGVVTTVLSSNVTAAFVELFDQTASPDVTLASGVTLSSAPVGSLIFKESLLGVALNLKSSAAGFIEEAASAGQPSMTPFVIGKKTGAVTIMRLTYTTTNNPSTGAIEWFAEWSPLSADGNLS